MTSAFNGGGPPRRSRAKLYDLLPTIYRRRDEELVAGDREHLAAMDLLATIGLAEMRPSDRSAESLAETHVAPLKALFAIVQEQFDELEREIAQLYDDWFVETCAPEMLPLLAEPLAIRELEKLQYGRADLRAIVANIVDYRRRKGTADALEDFASAATGWTVRVGEGLASLAGTARVQCAEDQPRGFHDVRRRPPGAKQPWRHGRSVDVGDAGGGIRAAAIDVLRVQGALVTGAEPGRPRPDLRRARTFSPLGDDKVLMRPVHRVDETDGGVHDYVVPLTRAEARADLAESGRIRGIAIRRLHWLSESEPPLRVADLSAWREPSNAAGDDPRAVYVDPELGRLLVPDGLGIYDVDYTLRRHEGIGAEPAPHPWPGTFGTTLLVAAQGSARGRSRRRRLEAQLLSRVLTDPGAYERNRTALNPTNFDRFFDEWAFIRDAFEVRHPHRIPGIEEFMRRFPTFPFTAASPPVEWTLAELAGETRRDDAERGEPFERFSGLGPALRAAEQASGAVRIVLATSETQSWPGGWRFDPGPELTALSIESAPGTRPSISGALRLLPRARLPIRLIGLNVRGPVVCGAHAEVTIASSTLQPVTDAHGRYALLAEPGAERAPITVRNTFLGGARLAARTPLAIEDCVVMQPVGPLEPGSDPKQGPMLAAKRSTFLGAVVAHRITASDVLFDAPATAHDTGQGHLRYCAIRTNERLPQRYKCYLSKRQVLTSTRYGRWGFARVRANAPIQVRTGSSDGSEIGAYGPYRDAARQANLDLVLDDFLPERVSRRIRYVT